jgi:hypothetical protein
LSHTMLLLLLLLLLGSQKILFIYLIIETSEAYTYNQLKKTSIIKLNIENHNETRLASDSLFKMFIRNSK